MGRGDRVHFWDDCWVPESDALSSHLLEPILVELSGKPAVNFLRENGQCNWNLFSHLIDYLSLMPVTAVKPSSSVDDLDFKVMWQFGIYGRSSIYTRFPIYLWNLVLPDLLTLFPSVHI